MITELLTSIEVKKDDQAAAAKLTDRLTKLLSYNESAEKRDKVGRLSKGFLPNAIGFSSFLDLRPNITSDRTSISEFVPIVQFRIRTEDGDDDEELFVFQLDERALEKLLEAVKDVQKKFEIIKNDPMISKRIVA